jgi:dipeptidase E
MKLFLCSKTVTRELAPYFIKLIGKDPKEIKLALIENAADVEQGPKDWVIQNRKALQSLGLNIENIDLSVYRDNQLVLKKKLASQDVIWIGGGNTYYLRWLLRETGADDMIKEVVNKGVVYGGGSAGAIIAGLTLKYFETADDPDEAPKVILDGLKLTNFVVVPHVDNDKFKSVIFGINNKLKTAGYETIPLTDSQALVIDGDRQEVI